MQQHHRREVQDSTNMHMAVYQGLDGIQGIEIVIHPNLFETILAKFLTQVGTESYLFQN